MDVPQVNLLVIWLAIAGGMVSGAVMGLAFHHAQWQGGYGSWRRRLMRLGHISFFGLAFVNLAFVNLAFIQAVGGMGEPAGRLIDIAGWSLVVATVAMPTVCFLSAWRQRMRHLFFVPVGSALVAVALTLVQVVRVSL